MVKYRFTHKLWYDDEVVANIQSVSNDGAAVMAKAIKKQMLKEDKDKDKTKFRLDNRGFASTPSKVRTKGKSTP